MSIIGCNISITGNSFSFNSAYKQGGAIYYNLYSPVGLLNNIFLDNTAPYGPNYASYPFKLGLINQTSGELNLKSLVSGGEVTQPMLVGIYDQ